MMYYLAALSKITQPSKFNEYLTEIYSEHQIKVFKKCMNLTNSVDTLDTFDSPKTSKFINYNLIN